MRQVTFQKVGDFAGRLKPVGGVFRVQFLDDVGEPFGHVGIDVAHRPDAPVADAADHRHGRLGSFSASDR